MYLLHPFMLHSASRNLRRNRRVITNPPVSFKQPFGCGRKTGKDRTTGGIRNGNEKERTEKGNKTMKLNLVERKTLRELGLEKTGLGEWRIEGERRGWVSERMKRYEEARRMERERLEKEKGIK